ncbi:metallophosphoesterase [Pendulispora albinea]|uniref:Metallophosphoesterase n=1 Tax=Pendulispora albinea TaxID=2741071 RepID=A0ABZ2LTC5_9BACT
MPPRRTPRVFVLGDIHLFRHTPRSVVDDLAALLARHPGDRFVFAGDLLDLSAESPRHEDRHRTAEGAILAHAPLRAALARHVDQGGELWLVSGNHDAEVGEDDFAGRLAGALGIAPSARARLRTTPWFFRDHGIHIEHGHLYDPDNAPAHPLASGPSLGVHFVEEFIAPTGAHRYLNANDGTPLKLFLSSFQWYGVRAPHVIYRFFHTAFGALGKSGARFGLEDQRARGRALTPAFAESVGLARELLDELLSDSPRPTLASARATFARCYLDRVLATVTATGGAMALVSGHKLAGGAALSLGAIAMLASWATGYDRYTGSVVERLAAGAARVANVTGSKLVVFGHTHREALGPHYANTGSFSFPGRSPGRPYLEIEGPPESPRAVRRYVTTAPAV